MKRLAVGFLLLLLLVTSSFAVEDDHGFHFIGSYALAAQFGNQNAVIAGLLKETFDEVFSWEDIGANLAGLMIHSWSHYHNCKVKWEPLPVKSQDFEAIAEKAFSDLIAGQ